MKFEEIGLEKFRAFEVKDKVLNGLTGGSGCKTSGGIKAECINGTGWVYDYGYDIDRNGVITYHDRKNKRLSVPSNCG